MGCFEQRQGVHPGRFTRIALVATVSMKKDPRKRRRPVRTLEIAEDGGLLRDSSQGGSETWSASESTLKVKTSGCC